MKRLISIALLIIVAAFAASAQVPSPPTEDCIAEHHFEYRAIYEITEAGCVLDYTEYTTRGDFWTAYGHPSAQEALGRK